MAKKVIYKLCIEEGGRVYAPVVVGYLSDGSYFIKDLSRKRSVYNIQKMRISNDEMGRFGTHYIPLDRVKQWRTAHKPKLIHHISGEVHISGTNIISGNYKSVKKSKGVQVDSPHHTDGGPMCVSTFWGLRDFEEVDLSSSGGNNIVFSSEEITDLHPSLYEKDDATDAHTFEFFYMGKKMKEVVDINGSVQMNHPHFGVVTFKILDHHTNNPAVFAVMCRRSRVGWDTQHGIVYGGGATISGVDGYHEQILVIYPFEELYKKFIEEGNKVKVKNLDFSLRFRVWCLVDDFLNKILSRIFKK